ncbi:wall-associated receptor kinase 3-like [Triticum dicoccoides]|uniref:wall-associated receptor kinase 3-like n=1 Tax=Triticum dicoccoides TaxID=85692 RepID=UPI001891C0C6|nr:wall-associated receptor kinase 3-like [Triticum dicoccoides]
MARVLPRRRREEGHVPHRQAGRPTRLFKSTGKCPHAGVPLPSLSQGLDLDEKKASSLGRVLDEQRNRMQRLHAEVHRSQCETDGQDNEHRGARATEELCRQKFAFRTKGFPSPSDVPYSLSASNELVLLGCDVQAAMLGHLNSNDNGPDILSGCVSFCNFDLDEDPDVGHIVRRGRDREGHGRRRNPNDKYCHGMGCCQTHISQDSTGGMPKQLSVGWLHDQNEFANKTLSPALVFVAEEGWFDELGFSGMLGPYKQPPSRAIQEVPIILQWEILSDKPNCTTSTNMCKSKHSRCKQGNRGYTCHCEDGYNGNPYAANAGQGCKAPDAGRHKSMIIGESTTVSVGAGLASAGGLIVSVLVGWFISSKAKHQKAQMLKRKFCDQNRGQLLQQLVSQRADISERMIIPLEELEKATNNFDKALELSGGGHGTVYKGILSDLHVVAIKKPKKIIQREIDEFINEVAILSQINHRNVVKLYGCCLETEVPMLVYEFISNGTLFDHLHIDGPRSLSWEDRLRIAVERAKSLVYLHSTASMPIIHRDVKSVNILLDNTLTAKVADFGASRYILVEKSGLTTMVQGTIGYLDPMYFYTGRLTDKSDVYSYGVMLVELLTRRKPFSYLSSKGEGLVAHFVALFEEGNLSQILGPQITDEGGKEVEETVALAVACTKLRGEDRPTMRQVELTLEGLRPSKEYNILHEFGTNKLQNSGVAINSPSTIDGRSIDGPTRQYSMEEELAMSSSNPRLYY